ncbi:hypothetical protein C8054_11205 [Micromonospora sp. RP3T]|nr:hypothetical protein C8054_11205 [Micromonospora sp. RP3T]
MATRYPGAAIAGSIRRAEPAEMPAARVQARSTAPSDAQVYAPSTRRRSAGSSAEGRRARSCAPVPRPTRSATRLAIETPRTISPRPSAPSRALESIAVAA